MKQSQRVTFKMLRIAEDNWQIVAECSGRGLFQWPATSISFRNHTESSRRSLGA
jgi:hypothetical protein